LRTQTRRLRRLMRDLFDAGLEYLLENLRDTRYGDRHDVYWCGTSLTPQPPLIPDPTCGILRPNTVTGTVFGRPGL